MASRLGNGSWKNTALLSARLFQELPERTTTSLLAQAHRTEVPANVRLCSEGEAAGHLFLINRGQISYDHLTHDGKQSILFWLQPGDSFGLGALLANPHPYVGSATSVSQCQVYSWNHVSICRLALAYPQLTCNALAVVLHYFSLLAERHSGILGSTARGRVAKALLELGKRAGAAKTTGIDIRITNDQLASMADVSPFTVSRLLSGWSRKGTVQKSRKNLQIIAPEELLPYAR